MGKHHKACLQTTYQTSFATPFQACSCTHKIHYCTLQQNTLRCVNKLSFQVILNAAQSLLTCSLPAPVSPPSPSPCWVWPRSFVASGEQWLRCASAKWWRCLGWTEGTPLSDQSQEHCGSSPEQQKNSLCTCVYLCGFRNVKLIFRVLLYKLICKSFHHINMPNILPSSF